MFVFEAASGCRRTTRHHQPLRQSSTMRRSFALLAILLHAIVSSANINCYSCITTKLSESPFLTSLPTSARPLTTGPSCCDADEVKTVSCKDFCFHGIFEAWQKNGTLTRGYWRDCHSRVTTGANADVETLFANATMSTKSWGDGPVSKEDPQHPFCTTNQVLRTVAASPCTTSECGQGVVNQLICAAVSANQPAARRVDCTTTALPITTTTTIEGTTIHKTTITSTTKANDATQWRIARLSLALAMMLAMFT